MCIERIFFEEMSMRRKRNCREKGERMSLERRYFEEMSLRREEKRNEVKKNRVITGSLAKK
jgi:ribosomal protein S21